MVAEAEMPSEGVPGGTTDRVLVPAAAAALPVWDLEVEASIVATEALVAVAADDAGRGLDSATQITDAHNETI